MDESDDDFKELCASFFQRVRKNATKEVSGERKKPKTTGGSQRRGKLKETSQAATRTKSLQGPSEKKPRSGSQASRTKKQGTPKSQEGDPALPVHGKGGVLAPTPRPVLCEKAQGIQTGNQQGPLVLESEARDVCFCKLRLRKLAVKGQVAYTSNPSIRRQGLSVRPAWSTY